MSVRKYFLDEVGLNALWERIKDRVSASEANINSGIDSLESNINIKFSAVNNELTGIKDNINEIYDSIPNESTFAKFATSINLDGTKIRLYNSNGDSISDFDASEFLIDNTLEDATVVTASASNPIDGKTSGKFIKYTLTNGNIIYLSVDELGLNQKPLTANTIEEAKSLAVADNIGRNIIVNGEAYIVVAVGSIKSLVDSEEVESRFSTIESRMDVVESKINDWKVETPIDIKKSAENEYYVESGDESKSATSKSIVDALNEISNEFKSMDLSNYYTKEETDDEFVSHENLENSRTISESEIESIFK